MKNYKQEEKEILWIMIIGAAIIAAAGIGLTLLGAAHFENFN